MAARTDLPRVKGPKPTLLNYDLGIGAIAGQFVSAATLGVGMLLGFSISLPLMAGAIAVTTIGGAAIGAASGKARMEKEQIEGRQVHEPSIINRGWGFGLFGAVARMNEMKHEVAEAENIQRGGGRGGMMQARTQTIGMNQQVTAQDIAMLEARMRGAAGNNQNFAEAVRAQQNAQTIQQGKV